MTDIYIVFKELINTIFKEEKYLNIVEKNNKIRISRTMLSGMPDPEVYILVKRTENKIRISEFNRNNERYVLETEDLNFALSYFVVLVSSKAVKRKYDLKYESKLERLVMAGELTYAEQLVRERCQEKYFSYNSKKANCVCMVKEGEKYLVIYYYNDMSRKKISEDKDITRIFLVTYTFALKLQAFESIIKKLEEKGLYNFGQESYDLLLTTYMF